MLPEPSASVVNVASLFTIVCDGMPSTSVSTGGVLHGAETGHAGSPPPPTRAIFVTVLFAVLTCGVTLIVNATVLFGAVFDKPANTVQLTSWPEIVQPVAELIVSPAGMVSLATASTSVGPVPLLVTVMT